ncbi:hypothetical protein, partial [Phocaeicola vulgatus]
NKNLMPEEAKILMESLSKFEAPLSQMYVKIVDQEDRKLQRIYETRNKIIDVLVILAQSNYENANRIIEILKQELDHLKEEEKEVREDSKNEKNRTFSIWDKVAWGALIILCAAIFGGGNKNDTSKKN